MMLTHSVSRNEMRLIGVSVSQNAGPVDHVADEGAAEQGDDQERVGGAELIPHLSGAPAEGPLHDDDEERDPDGEPGELHRDL